MLNGQPDYINAVIAITTQLAASELMQALLAIESSQGRVRNGERWQARTLDIDILLFGNISICESDLVIPHYGLTQRAFVLVPLNEISPDLILPHGAPLTSYLTATIIDEVTQYEA
jgi:2-amino-4-hydroxy-6-hydroxymethyldihydropteridine diphosphokinase